MKSIFLLSSVFIIGGHSALSQGFRFSTELFCMALNDVYRSAPTNFSTIRTPDWRSKSTKIIFDSYSNQMESTVTGDDSTIAGFHYKMLLNTSKHQEAKEAMRVFEDRVLHCMDELALGIVNRNEAEDKDSLHAVAGVDDKYKDIGVSISIKQSPTDKHAWWLHFDLTNNLRDYSFAADIAEHQKSAADMAAAIEADRKSDRPVSNPNETLCEAIQRLIAQRDFCWSEIKTGFIQKDDKGGEMWGTRAAFHNTPIYIASTPFGDPEDHHISCSINFTLDDNSGWDQAQGDFNFYAGEIFHCTVQGVAPVIQPETRDQNRKEWRLELPSGKRLRIVLGIKQKPQAKNYYVLLQIAQAS